MLGLFQRVSVFAVGFHFARMTSSFLISVAEVYMRTVVKLRVERLLPFDLFLEDGHKPVKYTFSRPKQVTPTLIAHFNTHMNEST